MAITLGKTIKVDAQLKVGDLSEVVQVSGAPQDIDVRSTLVAHNVREEEIDRLPKGRSFQSIALTAPSVNSGEIEGGFQVNGASGAENAFTVDGVVTNSLVNGQSRQNTVFEYLQEVQVKTARHRRRVRRRARRRDQRGDQVGRQHVPRRGSLLLRGQRRSAPAR